MKNIKKLIVATSLFLGILAFAQSPQKMSYQAVVRNATNNLVTSQVVGMKISILQGSATGTAVYAETQTPTSNTNGLVTLEIGGGTVETGTFATINWANGPFFIKTETDPTGGTSYTITGTSQLLSVPFAMYAATSGSSTPGPQGIQGIAGPAGTNGTNGVDGAVGPMGPQGPAGLNGTNGTNGVDGAVGPQGPIGLTGATGPMGPMGPQGPAGLNGTNGTNGVDGAVGPMGPQGPAGLNGINGTNGVDGAVGPQGPAGTNGTNGANGQGVPTGGTTGQVLSKINATDFNTQWVTPNASASTYPNVELQIMNNAIQQFTGRSGTNNTTTITWSGSNNANAALTGGNTFDGTVFTVGSTGAGWYDINAQTKGVTSTGTLSGVGIVFLLSKNNSPAQNSLTGSQYPSTVNNNTGALENRQVSTIRAIMYLAAGETVRFYGQSFSTTVDGFSSTDGSTNITIMRLK